MRYYRDERLTGPVAWFYGHQMNRATGKLTGPVKIKNKTPSEEQNCG